MTKPGESHRSLNLTNNTSVPANSSKGTLRASLRAKHSSRSKYKHENKWMTKELILSREESARLIQKAEDNGW